MPFILLNSPNHLKANNIYFHFTVRNWKRPREKNLEFYFEKDRTIPRQTYSCELLVWQITEKIPKASRGKELAGSVSLSSYFFSGTSVFCRYTNEILLWFYFCHSLQHSSPSYEWNAHQWGNSLEGIKFNGHLAALWFTVLPVDHLWLWPCT
jgi:hypothetical protein